MFGKLMNSYYYGKSGKGDYRKEDLPKNRWQLFWEMLRVRLSGLMRLNLMYAVPWLPALLVLLYHFMGWYGGSVGLMETYASDTAVPFAQMQQFTYSVVFGGLLMLIPCILITGPFTAGVAFVTRNWARDEHAFVWSDFKDAVKANWKQGLAVSAITAVAPLLVYVCWSFYGQMAGNSFFFVIPQVLTLMLGLIWFLMTIYLYPLMVTYKLTFRQLLRNGLLLAVGRLPQSAGLRLLSAVPVAIGLAVAIFFGQIQWVVFALVAYYVLIGFGLSRFIYASYANAVFDRFINVHLEGVQINRGLSQEAEDEDDEEEAEE